MEPVKLVIATHGQFGIELMRSAEMLIGPMQAVYLLSLRSEDNFDTFVAHAQALLTTLTGPVCGLVDLNGGTPANAMTFLTRQFPMRVVAGLNLPMLLEGYLQVSRQPDTSLAEVVQTCLQAGQRSVVETTAKYQRNKS
jgi:PTS system mannose-specific IIA component/D-glucosaminate-specific PTS system IIA component